MIFDKLSLIKTEDTTGQNPGQCLICKLSWMIPMLEVMNIKFMLTVVMFGMHPSEFLEKS